MKGFRLGIVLRARSAQENAARAEMLQARQEAAEAAERVRRMDAAIDARPKPEGPTGAAMANALWARHAMAADLSAAIEVAGRLDAQVDERAADLTVAAQKRRTVEKLAERHADTARQAEEHAAQREADDLTSSRTRGGNPNR
jgi:flagellar protein FliJ